MMQNILDIILQIKNNNNIDTYNVLKQMIQEETDTVEYMLRALSFNYIGNKPIELVKVNDIDILDSYKLIVQNIKPRLVIAFGPSASGKTSCSNNMIHYFSTIYNDFPTCFFTLDGGRLRSASNVFQMIVRCANENNVDIVSYNLFPKVKHKIMKYIENQIIQYNTPISLYIPITLGKSYIESYSKYIEITKDYNWIGIFIWQHKYDCIYEDKYKCNSCIKSGKEREKIEGKKYKEHKWEKSMSRGLNEVKKAPGGFLTIHNSGRPNGSMTVLSFDNMIITIDN
jgi:hypothetical protein